MMALHFHSKQQCGGQRDRRTYLEGGLESKRDTQQIPNNSSLLQISCVTIVQSYVDNRIRYSWYPFSIL